MLLGHSERRAGHGESDELVSAKASAALEAGLSVMVCVGESLWEREQGRAEEVVSSQLSGSLPKGAAADRLMIAYEPVWAIGTGKVASEEEIGLAHGSVRGQLAELGLGGVPILYGGSVKPDNAASILALDDVGGSACWRCKPEGGRLRCDLYSRKNKWSRVCQLCPPRGMPAKALEFTLHCPYNSAILDKVETHGNSGPDHPHPDCAGTDRRGFAAAF